MPHPKVKAGPNNNLLNLPITTPDNPSSVEPVVENATPVAGARGRGGKAQERGRGGQSQNKSNRKQSATVEEENMAGNEVEEIEAAAPTVAKNSRPKPRPRTQIAPVRDPLPERTTRAVNIADPDKPRRRKTSAEVAAAKRAAIALEEQKQAQYQEHLHAQAHRELATEAALAEEQANVVLRLSDIDKEEDPFNPFGDENHVTSGEEFNFSDVDRLLSEESDVEENTLPPKRSKRPTKPARGATRTAVDTIKAVQGAAKETVQAAAGHSTPVVQGKGGRAGKSKETGLPSNWKALAGRETTDDQSALGAITDDIMLSTRPAPGQMSTMIQFQNNMVSVALGKSHKDKRASASKNKNTNTSAASTTNPPSEAVTHATVTAAKTSHARTKNSNTKLPQWVEKSWEEVVLPSLYHKLCCSELPFMEFTKDNFAKHIQAVLDKAFPGHSWTVEVNDALARIIERRGKAGSLTLAYVEKFFNKLTPNNPVSIKSYVEWALPNGPALFGIPVKRDHPMPDDPMYMSVFGDLGHPIGALALVATGVEQAFLAFETRSKSSVGEFSNTKIGTMVSGYMVNIQKLSARRWKSILTKCQVEMEQQSSRHQPLKASQAMQAARSNLYIGSPVKGHT
ncbi:hypothetical protein BT96DRAFT_1007773 [Gymnopus androsaceus JB14]|uniref:Uncharacterized protein n=1 Tax=Gymnopus androsaceus JB14 TaxID=1447944 RepID=A0A6A4GGZ3_9AGAR|nr:hypothetical protein BT96DRAFT_1007773 [Gymnopus androsaceus JB14]